MFARCVQKRYGLTVGKIYNISLPYLCNGNEYVDTINDNGTFVSILAHRFDINNIQITLSEYQKQRGVEIG